MIDAETHTQVQVISGDDAWPYLMVPLEQLPEVRRVLNDRGIVHFVARDAVQLDGKPAIAIIDFSRDEDAAVIQAALDNA